MAKSSKIDDQKVFERNFATEAKFRGRVMETVLPIQDRLREERVELEDEWEKFFNMWNVTHDEHHTYNGRARLYIPEVRKNIEAQARQFTKAAIPNEDFFDVSPGEGGTRKGALIRKSIARWQIEQSKLRKKLHVFFRQEIMLGTSPAYIPWSEKTNQVFRRARGKDGKIKPSRALVKHYCGPDFITRDLFRWYAMNPMAESHKDDGCFEDILINYFELLHKSKKHTISQSLMEEITAGPTEAEAMAEMDRYIRRIEKMGLQVRSDQAYAGEFSLKDERELPLQLKKFMCTMTFAPMIFPEACLEGEDPDLPVPMQIEWINNKPISIRRNQFWHQQDPYLVGRYILPNADEFYGQGMPWALQYMQHELNSTAEQTMDSKTMALNPLSIIDPALAAQLNDFEIAPGAKWFVRPDGVKLASLPDLSGTGYNAMGFLRGQMQEYADRTPALSPQLQGKARSATQADIVNTAFQIDLESFQVNNELDVLQPMLKMWESLTDQNISDDTVIMILGRRSSDWRRKLLKHDSILGSYEYFWKSTSQLQNKPIKARQMIDMLKVAGSLPPEAQAQLKLRYDEAFKVLWSEMMELPDADRIIGGMSEMVSQDPEVEFKMLNLGMELEVLPGDNHEEHMKRHDSDLKELPEGSDEYKELARHMMTHQIVHKRIVEMMVAQEKMRQAMAQAQLQAQAQGQGGPAQPQRYGNSQGSGNRTQLSPNATVGDQASGMRP